MKFVQFLFSVHILERYVSIECEMNTGKAVLKALSQSTFLFIQIYSGTLNVHQLIYIYQFN